MSSSVSKEFPAVFASASASCFYSAGAEHVWTISDYENKVNKAAPNTISAASRSFTVHRHTNSHGFLRHTFKLRAFFNGHPKFADSSSSVGVCLVWEDPSIKYALSIRCKFYLLRGRNMERCMEVSHDLTTFSEQSPSNGVARAFSKQRIAEDKKNLVFKGALRLGCSFQIICDTWQPKSSARLRLEAAYADSVNAMSSGFNSLLNSKESSDVKLICEGTTFHCHKIVLAARSDMFRRMFSHVGLKEAQGVVDIADADPDAVAKMLSFMYRDKCQSLGDHAMELLQLSDRYDVPLLKLQCEKWLAENISTTNAIDILNLAYLHSSEQLMEVALNYVALNMAAVKRMDGWDELAKGHPNIIEMLHKTVYQIEFTQCRKELEDDNIEPVQSVVKDLTLDE